MLLSHRSWRICFSFLEKIFSSLFTLVKFHCCILEFNDFIFCHLHSSIEATQLVFVFVFFFCYITPDLLFITSMIFVSFNFFEIIHNCSLKHFNNSYSCWSWQLHDCLFSFKLIFNWFLVWWVIFSWNLSGLVIVRHSRPYVKLLFCRQSPCLDLWLRS